MRMSISLGASPEAARGAARWAPVIVGVVTAIVVVWVGVSLERPPTIHDEAAYLLQAELLSRGRISAPSPPITEFFEQTHVLVEPRLVPKYPPGHAVALLPGVMLGLPALSPALFSGIAAGFLFALARRLAGTWVAYLTWMLWATAPRLLDFRSTYLSEITTGALCIIAFWILSCWWEAERGWQLPALAGVVAGVLLTRPLTGMALVVPAGVVVFAGLRRGRSIRRLGHGLVVGTILIALLPVWNSAATGDWATMPFTIYAETYIPWDRLGFGLDTTEGTRALPTEWKSWAEQFAAIHSEHTVRALPGILVKRVHVVWRDLLGPEIHRMLWTPFLIIGLFAMARKVRIGLLWAAAHLAVYLLYAHPPVWSVYYYEIQALIAFVTAAGFWWVAEGLFSRRYGSAVGLRRAQLVMMTAVLVVLALGYFEARGVRTAVLRRIAHRLRIERQLASIEEPLSVVFVRFRPESNAHRSLIENSPDFEAARHWIVRDRGDQNCRLLGRAVDRAGYVLDEKTTSLRRFSCAEDGRPTIESTVPASRLE
jgi:4-amino-4-deoxy-L-arabinose transferase-like glycosyltransferase